jgi:hypothetical protein
MSIANELSGDVAATVLARHDGEDTSALKDVIETVHITLRDMHAEARRANRRSQERPEPPSSRSGFSGKN